MQLACAITVVQWTANEGESIAVNVNLCSPCAELMYILIK
jgi:hypothetical protein